MWAYIEREFRIAARSWEVLTSSLLIASALGLVFGEYAAGLVAANLVASALHSYVQILREEELGTLDGLRLLGQPEKVVGAKFLVLFSILPGRLVELLRSPHRGVYEDSRSCGL